MNLCSDKRDIILTLANLEFVSVHRSRKCVIWHSNFHPNYNDVNGGLPALGRLRSLAICVGASRFSGGRLANRRESRSLFTDTAACTTAGCTAFYARHEPSSFGTAVVRTTTAATKTATPSTTTTLAAKLVTTTALHRNKSNTTATSTASTARIQSATNSTLKTKTATAGSATGEATTAIATKLINKSHQSSFAALANTVDGGATASHSPCRKPSNPPPAHSAAVVPTAQTTAVAAISAPASSTTAATTTTPVSRTSSSAPPTPSPLRRTRRQSTLYTNPLGGTGTSPQTPTPHAPRRASPSHRGRISPSSGSPHRAHLLLTMDGARPVYNYYHPSHGSTSAMSAGIGGGIAAGGGGSAGIGSGHNYGYRRPSSAVRRSMVRSQTSARSRRRASSARSSRQDGANLMDRQCALVLMYGIYFFYVLACFGAISTFAGLMLQISSKQPDAHDKGKIISGVGK
ncbi:hypothetical protein BIW11_12197 [Tropilaelaps mercedesae]|uniref:Uncharacterized protein n=1 Tax=Tropilaelaps mercedesae TaxID=418985 RepID=A0A1V9X7H9_9ACAR|nr:hypothetical protein BIW11_12197 [Tropilaelaps mercedesae]